MTFNWQYISTDSYDSLVLNRWQVIIWTNHGLVYWCICVTQPQWIKKSSILNYSHTWYAELIMITSSNGNIFRITGPLWGEPPVKGRFSSQRAVNQSFVFFDLCLYKQLSKEWRSWWFETPSCASWRHCNVLTLTNQQQLESIWDIV